MDNERCRVVRMQERKERYEKESVGEAVAEAG